jgi:chromosome segregation ATPase
MVIVQTREETSNVTIRRLSSQVDQLSSKDEDMMKTIQKLNTRNADLLDGLDQAKKNQSSTDKARQDLELEAAKLKTSLNTAAGNLSVTETKLRSLEAEFQENKKRIVANNRKVETMQVERDQETERAKNLAVEMAKIKKESTAEHAKVADKIKILETQLAKTEKDRAAGLKESEKNLVTAHKHNMDLQSNSERAQAEAIKLKKELSTERAQAADKIESMEKNWTAAKKERDTALEESQKSLVTAHKHNMDLLSDLELTQAEVASLKEAIAGISSETNALAKLRTELEEAQMAYEVQQAMLAGKEALLQGAEEDLGRLEELEKNYAEAEKARTTLQQQLDNQEKSLVALTDGDKSVQEHLKNLIAEKSDLSSQLDALKDRHALMTVDFSSLGGRLELAQAGQAKALSRIKDLQLTIAGERQEKGTLDKQLKQLEQSLEKNQASLDDAQKSAGGRLKEKTEVERLHARVLADQEKSLQSIRGELRAAREDADSWKAKTTDALAAQKAENKATDDVKRSSGSSARTIAGLQKALADQEEDLNAKNAEISKIKSGLAKSNQSLETAKSEQEKLEKTLEQATSANDKSASSLVRERDEALRLLEAKEAEISDLKKKKESQKSKPILRRGARMNDVVPVPLLEQLGQMTPMIEIQAKGEAGFSVEYQGFGTIDLVLPE